MTDKSGTSAPYDKLLEQLDEGANYRGYSEGFGGSWTGLCAKAAQAIRNLTRASLQPATPTARNVVIEECAKVLDDAAQDWNRIRDPGMANNARSYARKIRTLATATGGDVVAGDATALCRLEAFFRETRPFGYVKDNEVIEKFLASARAALRSPDVAGDVQAATPSSAANLEEAIRTAETMLSEHIEEFHDFDYQPHEVPPELQQLRNIQHHLLGTLVELDPSMSNDLAQPSWQPIETAPRDGTRILMFQAGRGAFEGWWHDGWPHAEHYWMDDQDSEPAPTHWQPTLAIPSTERNTP